MFIFAALLAAASLISTSLSFTFLKEARINYNCNQEKWERYVVWAGWFQGAALSQANILVVLFILHLLGIKIS